MVENKLDSIPEYDVAPVILESNSIPLIQETISTRPENDSAPLVPDIDSPKVVSASAAKHGHVRRNSTGNIGIPYKSVKILSRYLAASMGSCHDTCKYGTRLDLETKTPISLILGRRMEQPGNGQEDEKTITSAERNTTLAVSFTPSLNSKSRIADSPILSKTESHILSKTEVLSPGWRQTTLVKQHSWSLKGAVSKQKPMLSKSSTLPTEENSSRDKYGDEINEDKEKRISATNLPGASTGRARNKLESIKETETSVSDEIKLVARGTASSSATRTVKKLLTQQIVCLSPKSPGKRVSSMNTEKFKSQKGISHLKDSSDAAKSEYKHPSSEDIPKRTLQVAETNPENRTTCSSQNNVFSVSPSSIHNDKSLKHAAKVSSPLAHKLSRRAQTGICDSQSPSSPEKSLRRVKQGSHTAKSSISTLPSSKINQSRTFPEYHETKTEKKAAKVKADFKHIHGNGAVVSTKGKSYPVKKASFKKGKVLDHRPVMSSPIRHKCRQGFCESQVGKVETTESKLTNTEIHISVCEISVTKSDPDETVVKHQDREEKKAEPNLLNNMIEETANKLAETKKSKVQALVGAFETVISLRDSNPSSTADAC